jgi:hypothetical protein
LKEARTTEENALDLGIPEKKSDNEKDAALSASFFLN